MNQMLVEPNLQQFAMDVSEGLSKHQKSLPSKYFYDAQGDKIFQQIMAMPEYYLTNAEEEILKEQATKIASVLSSDQENLDILELGAGDGSKISHLLEAIGLQLGYDKVSYRPIDISSHVLGVLKAKLSARLPALSVAPICAEYNDALSSLTQQKHPKVILFLGSNLGNFSPSEAKSFLSALADNMNSGDKLLLGLDINQNTETLMEAYNDKSGITKSFNMNLLQRINRELGANFDLDRFNHAPVYVENEHAAYSYITSTESQSVHIEKLGEDFDFEAGELIHTEISRKYSKQTLEEIIEPEALEIVAEFKDSQGLFCDFLLLKP